MASPKRRKQPTREYLKKCERCDEVFSGTKKKRFCSRHCVNSKRRELAYDKNDLSSYRGLCSFKFGISSYPSEFDVSLVEKYGWYSAKNRGNNVNGVSRDHMVSVRYGFDNNIPPEHLAHPANCKLILHSDNVSKGKKCSITYDDLLVLIAEWDMRYPNK